MTDILYLAIILNFNQNKYSLSQVIYVLNRWHLCMYITKSIKTIYYNYNNQKAILWGSESYH